MAEHDARWSRARFRQIAIQALKRQRGVFLLRPERDPRAGKGQPLRRDTRAAGNRLADRQRVERPPARLHQIHRRGREAARNRRRQFRRILHRAHETTHQQRRFATHFQRQLIQRLQQQRLRRTGRIVRRLRLARNEIEPLRIHVAFGNRHRFEHHLGVFERQAARANHADRRQRHLPLPCHFADNLRNAPYVSAARHECPHMNNRQAPVELQDRPQRIARLCRQQALAGERRDIEHQFACLGHRDLRRVFGKLQRLREIVFLLLRGGADTQEENQTEYCRPAQHTPVSHSLFNSSGRGRGSPLP